MKRKKSKQKLNRCIGHKKNKQKNLVHIRKDINMFEVNADCWESEIDIVKECGKAPTSIRVNIKPVVRRKIDLLMDKYKSREWLGYLIGEGFNVHDLVIPDQIATGGSVDNVDYEFPMGLKVVGVIHSHHNMGASFSSKDDEWINKNHDISILVSHSGVAAQCRWSSPCGAKKIVPGKIVIDYDVVLDEKQFLEAAEIKIKAPELPQYNQYNWQNRFQHIGMNQSDIDESFPSLREAMSEM